jgi:hypothetical protein
MFHQGNLLGISFLNRLLGLAVILPAFKSILVLNRQLSSADFL